MSVVRCGYKSGSKKRQRGQPSERRGRWTLACSREGLGSLVDRCTQPTGCRLAALPLGPLRPTTWPFGAHDWRRAPRDGPAAVRTASEEWTLNRPGANLSRFRPEPVGRFSASLAFPLGEGRHSGAGMRDTPGRLARFRLLLSADAGGERKSRGCLPAQRNFGIQSLQGLLEANPVMVIARR